ncbi:MAG: glycosyltransferase family 2 protein [bacterium]
MAHSFETPSISVLMPIYNCRETLRDSIESIIRQTYTDWELIIVDDGSTDDSPEIVSEYARGDSRIRPIRVQHCGIVQALNVGLAKARGELLARQDGDDVSHPERLEKQAAFLREHPEVRVVGCLVDLFPKEAVSEGMAEYMDWINSAVTPDEILNDMFIESPLVHPSVMAYTEDIRRVGGYEEGPFPEDYQLWLKLWERGVKMAKVDEVLYFWREGPSRLSRNDPHYSVDNFTKLKADFLLRTHLKDRKTVVIWGAGRSGRRWAKVLEGHSIFIDHFIDIHPRRIGGSVRGRPVRGIPESLSQRRYFILCAVAVKSARAEIRDICQKYGLREREDFLFVM